MHLKRNDMVKLTPEWAGPQGPDAPVWGGSYGYILGRVDKLETGDHNKENHRAIIQFSNGHGSRPFHEDVLEKATDDEIAISSDFCTGKGYTSDIWALIRTSIGGFALNIIEVLPFGPEPTTNDRYVVGISKRTLSNMDNSDYNLVGSFMSAVDYKEHRVSTIYSGLMHLHNQWSLPTPDSLPLPLLEFPTVAAAVRTAPNHTKPSILLFHLPYNLSDFSEKPLPSVQSALGFVN